LRQQLTDGNGRPKYWDEPDRRVIYASPSVDVAGNMELVRETVEACKVILELTNWQIRLLSKSNLLPKVAAGLGTDHGAFLRVIYGVSTGTLDDGIAAAFEQGTAKVSKRLESLHWLQDHGFRTYGMICPSLPQRDYFDFASSMAEAIRAEQCEHVWAEVINVRGESMVRTVGALQVAGFQEAAAALHVVSTDPIAWERYARATFEAHATMYRGLWRGKLRFLQYVTASSRAWWKARETEGAILL
jgi:DNA repair photolyase